VTFGNGTTLQVQDVLSVNGNWTVLPGTATVNGGMVQTIGDFNLGGGGVLIANANFNVPGAANINSSGFVVNSQFTVNDSVNLSASVQAVINGALTTPNVNVGQSSQLTVFGTVNGNAANAGLLQGRGLVNGNVINTGTVSPGTSIGTLTVNGDYTQNASGTLRIEVAGSSPEASPWEWITALGPTLP
jgi:fibronectin-binding autotransporter adhesin